MNTAKEYTDYTKNKNNKISKRCFAVFLTIRAACCGQSFAISLGNKIDNANHPTIKSAGK